MSFILNTENKIFYRKSGPIHTRLRVKVGRRTYHCGQKLNDMYIVEIDMQSNTYVLADNLGIRYRFLAKKGV